MGNDLTHKHADRPIHVSLVCGNCGKEHTTEIGEQNDLEVTARLLEAPNVPVEVCDIEDRKFAAVQSFVDWLAETPKHPDWNYRAAINDLKQFEAQTPQRDALKKSFYRMLFTQYFSVFEAYLSNRVIQLVSEDSDALRSLVAKSFKDEKIDFLTALSKPDEIRKRVVDALRDVVWHNFPKIDHYYVGVFGCSMFPDDGSRTFLNTQSKIRHHCVHRNGFDLDQKRVSIDKSDIAALRDAIEKVVAHIEKTYHDYQSEDRQTEKSKAKIIEALLARKDR